MGDDMRKKHFRQRQMHLLVFTCFQGSEVGTNWECWRKQNSSGLNHGEPGIET